uniref:Sodium bicarbonate transporter-like protein 11 n=1 Tax=Sinocyclocheilus rhinocerous TaxID=307959 RepID=A0A673G5T9_9TELE
MNNSTHRDLDGFLAQASILLDERASSLDEVLRRMLEHVATDGQGSCNAEEVMSALFTDAGGQEANVHLLTETIQGVTATATGVRYQQSWLCVLCNVKSLQRRCVCVSRLERPQNWGVNCCEVRYVILILAPPRTKSTKTAIELGRTFATLFSDISFRQKLLETKTQEDFKQELVIQRQRLSTAIQKPSLEEETDPHSNKPLKVKDFLRAGRGIYEDLCRRLPLYLSDFTDGILDANRSLLKYTTTAIFLYIAILLPAIAFGSLNDESTQGEIGLCSNYKVLYSGKSFFRFLTLSLSALFIYLFLKLPATAIKMSCSLCAMCPLSSTEEVIALFISIAFVGDALKGTIKSKFRALTCKRTTGVAETNIQTRAGLILILILVNYPFKTILYPIIFLFVMCSPSWHSKPVILSHSMENKKSRLKQNVQAALFQLYSVIVNRNCGC